jgi:hypothetical protein
VTEQITAQLIVVWIPLLVVWVAVLIDLVRQPAMSRTAKILWAAACSLLWPVLIVYLLQRPTRGRLEILEARTDAHAELVDAVLAHENGTIDDAAMASIIRERRRLPS